MYGDNPAGYTSPVLCSKFVLTWSVCERFAENITAFKQRRPAAGNALLWYSALIIYFSNKKLQARKLFYVSACKKLADIPRSSTGGRALYNGFTLHFLFGRSIFPGFFQELCQTIILNTVSYKQRTINNISVHSDFS